MANTSRAARGQSFEHQIFPFARYRGDHRERFLGVALAESLDERHPSEILVPALRSSDVLEDLLDDHFVLRHGASRELVPFNVLASAGHRAGVKTRPKIFGGAFLAYLARNPSTGAVERDTLQALLDVYAIRNRMSVLEAAAIAKWSDGRDGSPSAARLEERLLGQAGVSSAREIPVLVPVANHLFLRDIGVLAELNVAGLEKVRYANYMVYLHVALFYWRLAVFFSVGRSELEKDISSGRQPQPLGDPFRGALKFRLQEAGRPVSQADPCAVAYRTIDSRSLLALPVNLKLLAAARSVGAAKGEEPIRSFEDWRLRRVEDPLFDGSIERTLERVIENAIQESTDTQLVGDLQSQRDRGAAPLTLAAEAIARTAPRGDLRRTSRQITSTVLPRGRSGLVATRGNVPFFELGQDLLLLLSRLAASSRGATTFNDLLSGLAEYGLAPQDPAETRKLLEVMSSLSLLDKYSDAGDATYVRHFL